MPKLAAIDVADFFVGELVEQRLDFHLPIEPSIAGAILNLHMTPHSGTHEPSGWHDLGHAGEVIFDERLPQDEIDRVIGQQVVRYMVAELRGDVSDHGLVAEVMRVLFALELEPPVSVDRGPGQQVPTTADVRLN
jgi:hypothetical protein